MSGDQQLVDTLAEVIDDESLTRTGRSIGTLASGHVARAVLARLVELGWVDRPAMSTVEQQARRDALVWQERARARGWEQDDDKPALSPDCRAGKHHACNGDGGIDDVKDEILPCACGCHEAP